MSTDTSRYQSYINYGTSKDGYDYNNYLTSASYERNFISSGGTNEYPTSYSLASAYPAPINYPVPSFDYYTTFPTTSSSTIDTKTVQKTYQSNNYSNSSKQSSSSINNTPAAPQSNRRLTAREEDLEQILNRWNLKLSDIDKALLDRFLKIIYRCVPAILSELDNLRLDVSNINSRFYQCLNDAEDLYYDDYYQYQKRYRRSHSRSRSRNRSKSRRASAKRSRSPSPPSQPYVTGPNTITDPRFEKLKPPVRTTLEGYISQGLFDLSTLDDRALNALSEMGTSSGLVIIKKFSEAKVETLRNASSYFMNIIKRYTEGTLRH